MTDDVRTLEGVRRGAEISGVARRRRAPRIAVFGSVARGEAHPGSDIDLLADLAGTADAAAELVGLGKQRWDAERPLRLAGEAVIGRRGDIATKVPDEVIEAAPEIPWRQVKGMRIIAAHAYHRIDYDEVWVTLRDDVPRLDAAIDSWRKTRG